MSDGGPATAPGGAPLLQVAGITLQFGGVRALSDVSFDVQEGELFAVIGPNGAGKTSIFNCLNGVYRPQQGSIKLGGVELVGKRWTGAILFVLMDGPTRFSEFKRLVPDLSDRLLSERMKELEAEGIVERHVIDDTPVRAEYTLTAKGQALQPAVLALKRWANAWL